MGLSADAGLTMAVYTAEPGSLSHDALNLLASWAVTLDQAETDRAMDGTLTGGVRAARQSLPGTGILRHSITVLPYLGSVRTGDAAFRREMVLEPVTNQVTTVPGNDRRSAT